MPTRQTRLPERLDRQFVQHLGQLGLSSVHEYRQWCVAHGFSRGLNKHSTMRASEVAVRRELIEAAATQKRSETRRPLDIMLAICEGGRSRKDLLNGPLQSFVRLVDAASAGQLEPPLEPIELGRMLRHLRTVRARFLENGIAGDRNSAGESHVIPALISVCRYRNQWVRELEDWRPQSKSDRRQFAELIRHLLAKYDDLPRFMDSAWTVHEGPYAAMHRRWYVHMGAGKNLRTCELPIRYTNRMAHAFVHAPTTLSIQQALRYGQVIGYGGDARTAEAIVSTRLAEQFDQDEFWQTVIRWFIDHPMLDRLQVGPIVDYIYQQRFVPEQVFMNGIQESGQPRQPNFTMRGRTPETLLRQVQSWHNELAGDNRVQVANWVASDIHPFLLVEGGDSHAASEANGAKRWTIRELLSSQALVAEGRQLKHCVASYAKSCANRLSSIWTVETEVRSKTTKLLTVEVRLATRTIVQVRGKANRLQTDKERNVIERWALQSKLRIQQGA